MNVTSFSLSVGTRGGASLLLLHVACAQNASGSGRCCNLGGETDRHIGDAGHRQTSYVWPSDTGIRRVSSFGERAPILLWLGSAAAPTRFVFLVIDGQEKSIIQIPPFEVCHVQLLCFGISGLPHVLHRCRTLPFCVEPFYVV